MASLNVRAWLRSQSWPSSFDEEQLLGETLSG
jgi:hypothetical protein